MFRVFGSLRRLVVCGLLVATLFGATASSTLAQYGTYFYYHNPRTGRSYSQTVYAGRGAAYGGFTYSTPNRYYSAGSGYRGRYHYSGWMYGR